MKTLIPKRHPYCYVEVPKTARVTAGPYVGFEGDIWFSFDATYELRSELGHYITVPKEHTKVLSMRRKRRYLTPEEIHYRNLATRRA